MEKEQAAGGGFLAFLLLLAALYFWGQNNDLKKQVTAYQTCVSYYQDQEQRTNTAIGNAKNSLNQLDSYNSFNSISNTHYYLNSVDITPIDCSYIPNFPTPKPY